ncbi:MAG: response regulator [Scytonematopsis contorta HA4267-MV1]|jgi:PAS domain S-box-containing protein|nr:response regulator [Scytonematopsis contorta HA4267-MV1]
MLRILIIDDNPNDRLLSIRELKREFPDFIVSEITDTLKFENALSTGNFDLVVTDYHLCWSNGLVVFKTIKDKYPECPVIMFTDSGNEEIAVEGMKAGLSDYVLKRQHFRRLTIAVSQCLEQQKMRQECAVSKEKLRVNEEGFRLAQDASDLGIWSWDLQSNSIAWNQMHEKLFGISPGSFDGSYEMFLNCIHSQDRNSVIDAVTHALENKVDYQQEFRVVWADGSIHWMTDRGRFFCDASGTAIRAIGIVLDITDRREREAALQKYADGITQAYRLQDEFLSIASHELRTPLNAILGWTQLLRKYNFDEATRNQRLETIERSLKRQQQLIEQILDTSRLVAGQMQLVSEVVDLKFVIESVINSARLSASAKSISLNSLLDNCPQGVLGNEKRLHQLIWNLISNAIKFTPVGGQVDVRLEVVNEDVAYAQITVSDTGQGISPDFIPYIFEPFRQQDGSTSRLHQGAGLGLTIVRQLVELHGGRVQAKSPGIGQGATFIVQLPLVRKNPSGESDSSSSVFHRSLDGLRVLVVDDDEDSLDLLVTLLEYEGAAVSVATSALQALQFLNQSKPDVLICDLVMPDIDGYKLLEHVKVLELEWGKSLGVIAITAHTEKEPIYKALKAGFQLSLSKPIEPEELITAISVLAQMN